MHTNKPEIANIIYLNLQFSHMTSDAVTIPRAEYVRLKKLEKVDMELISQLVESLEDAKNGRIRRVA